jgi:ankyrin repeat protein
MDKKETIRFLHKGIMAGRTQEVIQKLSEHPELLKEVSLFGSWLHLAAAKGHLEIAQFLLNEGIDVNLQGGLLGGNALTEAASSGHLPMVRYLLEQGSEMNVSTSKVSPLFGAIYGNHPEVAKELVKRGLDHRIHYPENKNGNATAIEFARLWGRTEIAEYLEGLNSSISQEKNP